MLTAILFYAGWITSPVFGSTTRFDCIGIIKFIVFVLLFLFLRTIEMEHRLRFLDNETEAEHIDILDSLKVCFTIENTTVQDLK